MSTKKITVEDDIKGAIDPSRRFGSHCGVYVFTNEYLNGYIPAFNLTDKKVLAPTASGDHAFNIAMQKPESITCFDINRLAKYWMEFKKASIMTLSFNEFKKLFINDFDKDLQFFDKIKEGLAPEMAYFWEQVTKSKTSKHSLFKEASYVKDHYKYNSYMQNAANYKKLKNILHDTDINYVNSDILELPTNLKGKKFDNVFTSNICDYIYSDEYKKFIEKDLKKILNPNAIVQTHYKYSCGMVKYFREPKYKGYQGETMSFREIGDNWDTHIHVLQRCE